MGCVMNLNGEDLMCESSPNEEGKDEGVMRTGMIRLYCKTFSVYSCSRSIFLCLSSTRLFNSNDGEHPEHSQPPPSLTIS